MLLLILVYTRAFAETITYQYDEGKRLIETSFDGNSTVHYVYDLMGNRLAKTVTDENSGNNIPQEPFSPVPADEDTNVDPQILLTWEGGDTDSEDTVFYTLYFANKTPITTFVSGLTQPQFQLQTLNSFTTYHWSVEAKDNVNSSTRAPDWSFTTGNTPPLQPDTLQPADATEVPYTMMLSWISERDPNPNDSIVFDVYLGSSNDPPLVAEGIQTTQYEPGPIWPRNTYYWKVVARDNNGATTSSPVYSFSFIDTDKDGLPDDLEEEGCTDPLNYDTDGDSIPDGMEDANLNGIVDSDETTPCSMDSDNDGMPDEWEFVYGLDPLSNDATVDSDGDGISNLEEHISGTDPLVADSVERLQSTEGFESGQFSKFYWETDPAIPWSVTRVNPFEGIYAAQSPPLESGESAMLQTRILCDAGTISFLFSGRTLSGENWLRFYIDGELQDQWSGNISYQTVSYQVLPGVHLFSWEYSKEQVNALYTEQVFLDHIAFPGKADSDGDGVLDGWELFHFGALDQDLCVDTDGDDLSDLEEAALLSSPHLADTDGDGMADSYEAVHNLNINRSDSLLDDDGDGDVNISEYLGGTNASDADDSDFAAMETLETGELERFFWRQSGEAYWTASVTNPYAGIFALQPDSLHAGETAILETELKCQQGIIAFHYSLLNDNGTGTLAFYIDGELQQSWTETADYEQVVFKVTAGTHTFSWKYQHSGDSDENNTAWLDNIIFPGVGDSDGDGVVDAWEINFFDGLDNTLCQDSDGDGLNDLQEAAALSSPFLIDTDGDGMSDAEEIAYNYDPNFNDALADDDGDGVTNSGECLAGTDPHASGSYSLSEIEDFETGNLEKFHWTVLGDGKWEPTSTNAYEGNYSAAVTAGGTGESVAMQTTLMSIGEGIISFYYALTVGETSDTLEFYMDNIRIGNLPETETFAFVSFPVSAGRHQYKWVYNSTGDTSGTKERAWLDSIIFPGLADSDSDGIIDSWEFKYLNSLDTALCGDRDNDGLSDLEEAMAGTDPSTADTDGDGMSDAWEVANGVDPLVDDGYSDIDGDGFSNYAEYMSQTVPDTSDMEVNSFEGFETGDFKKFYWILSGDDNWAVNTSSVQAGKYSAQAPGLADNNTASMATTIYSQGGTISFYVATSTQEAGYMMAFYINNTLMGEWSGETAYQFVPFDVQKGRSTFTWTFTKDDALAEGQDTVWIDSITFPGSADTDGDGILDGWEFRYFDTLDASLCGDRDNDGLSDLEEAMAGTDPSTADTDGDGMSDAWEVANGVDPLVDDGYSDIDGDGFSNYAEYMSQTVPDTSDMEVNSFEGFETGDFKKFYWILSGDDNWAVNTSSVQAGKYSAQAPGLADNNTASMATTIYSQGGTISFYVATSTQEAGYMMAFYINNTLMGEWSGETAYQFVPFDVQKGRSTFTWTFTKDDALAEGQDTVWIDSITFPGSADTDGDGILDGWEFRYFDTLDASLCGDRDNDGLSDLEEAMAGTNPSTADTDGDGMSDAWELANDLDPSSDDAMDDPDGDGIGNYYEYAGNSDPATMDHLTAGAFEGFESGTLGKFDWVVSGDAHWQVDKLNPYSGNYSVSTPALADNQTSSLETTINCEGGPIRFYVSTSSQADGDTLSFYLNGLLQAVWSGDTPYQLVSFTVPEGRNRFTWTYSKDSSAAAFEDKVWLDNISFPGKGDTDGDGILDGWEYRFFNGLDHALCGDSDNDGLLDLEEVVFGTDPLNPDTDGDGTSDGGGVAGGVSSADLKITLLSASEYQSKTVDLSPANIIVLEDAEDALLPGWDVFDNDPYGAYIDVRHDYDRDSLVLDFLGSGIENGYRFRKEDGTWLENNHTILQWDIKSEEHFIIYAVVQTSNGLRYLQYEPIDEDVLGDDEVIEHGLGKLVDGTKWYRIIRDLAFDLREAQPENSLQSILGVLVRGNCQIDDIITRTEIPENQDSDEDGITDRNEISVTKTHPYYADSDGDGLSDGDELLYWGDQWDHDDDEDGLINILDPDHDNNGILDGDQLQ
jgi:D-glucuronyl C5-epimerase, beta-sandwich domain/Bacterial TSP3 repeat